MQHVREALNEKSTLNMFLWDLTKNKESKQLFLYFKEIATFLSKLFINNSS